MKYLILPLLIFLLSHCSNQVEDLKICKKSIVNNSDQIAFSVKTWLQANEEKRGQMIMNLAENYKLINIKPTKIRSLLGQNTCYVNYNDEPCYKVKINQKTQFLAFSVAHSGDNIGKIIGAYLRNDPSTFSGCPYYNESSDNKRVNAGLLSLI